MDRLRGFRGFRGAVGSACCRGLGIGQILAKLLHLGGVRRLHAGGKAGRQGQQEGGNSKITQGQSGHLLPGRTSTSQERGSTRTDHTRARAGCEARRRLGRIAREALMLQASTVTVRIVATPNASGMETTDGSPRYQRTGTWDR